MKYTRNFSVDEFASKDGKDEDARMCQDFMNSLQALRDELDHPMIITSAIRSHSHNKAVGGATNSMHLSRPCLACDIAVINWSAAIKHRFIGLAISHGFNGIGISKNFIHIDKRKGFKSLWTY